MLDLRFLALVAAAALLACTQDPDLPEKPDEGPYVAVYFFDGRALTPIYRRLEPVSGVPPGTGLMSLLLAGPPPGRGLTTALPPGTRASAAEAPKGLLVELSGRFWSAPAGDVRRGAAQIVYSLAALEEGHQVTLLRGLVPGQIPGPDGRTLDPPLERTDFNTLRPWIRVTHPVAGAIVANPFPVDVVTRAAGPYRVTVLAGGQPVGRGGPGRVSWETPAAAGVVRITSGTHSVDVPVRFRP